MKFTLNRYSRWVFILGGFLFAGPLSAVLLSDIIGLDAYVEPFISWLFILTTVLIVFMIVYTLFYLVLIFLRVLRWLARPKQYLEKKNPSG